MRKSHRDRLLTFTVFLALFANACRAHSPLRVSQTFNWTNDVGFGNSIFVVGNHPDIGNWSPTGAVKLRWTSGNIWTGQVGIQSGTSLQYKFIRRSTDTSQVCNTNNTFDLSTVLSRNIAAQPPAPYTGKTILYHSTWSQAYILYRDGTNWLSAQMTQVGLGRNAGEKLFRVAGIGEAGETLEFVPNDGAGQWDNPPGGGNYITPLDVMFIQDKNVFNYQPPPSISAPTIQTIVITSSYPNIPARTNRIYLPRGYTQNTSKRYPVFYFHDGQNVFDPGTQFGSWSADATATTETSQGRMRECILVGVDNTPNRIPEYMPPTDSYNGTSGIGNVYLNYVLNNVRPYINNTYRTLTNPPNTFTGGSSLGGLISLYFGRESTNFSKIAILSPAFWIATNYMAQVQAGAKKPSRVYLDVGPAEGTDAWSGFQTFYDTLLIQDFAPNADSLSIIGCGDQHNEAAWKKRLPNAYRFLLNPIEEPNTLAQREYPPRLGLSNPNPDQVSIVFSSLYGFGYDVQQSTNLTGWASVTTTATEQLPWSSQQILDAAATGASQTFWRVQSNPQP